MNPDFDFDRGPPARSRAPLVEPFYRLALSHPPIYKTQVHALEVYFSRLRDIRGAGIGQRETSYYDALATLLTTYGRKLNPRVTCVMQIRNQGAGIPDGGLFTAEQLRGHRDRAEQAWERTASRRRPAILPRKPLEKRWVKQLQSALQLPCARVVGAASPSTALDRRSGCDRSSFRQGRRSCSGSSASDSQ
ncbi:MAG: putative adenine specific methyltransferase [Acidobacteriaceae bacterium]|nr:putative adenine specific methyltransferase [Acidobacteriaceae bacterium]